MNRIVLDYINSFRNPFREGSWSVRGSDNYCLECRYDNGNYQCIFVVIVKDFILLNGKSIEHVTSDMFGSPRNFTINDRGKEEIRAYVLMSYHKILIMMMEQ